MMNKIVFVTLILVGVSRFSEGSLENGPQKGDDILEDFIWEKLLNYNEWIELKSFDPSPLVPGTSIFPAYGPVGSVLYLLSKHGVRGLSHNVVTVSNVTAFTTDPLLVYTYFNISGNVSFFGEFSAEGTVNDTEISGNGTWSIDFSQSVHRQWGFSYKVHPNSTLEVFSPFMITSELGDVTNVNIENILDNGIGAQFREELIQEFTYAMRQYLRNAYSNEHPYKYFFLQYFAEVFSNTTWPPQLNNTL